MADTVVEALILDLPEWVTSRDRTYEEVSNGGLAHIMPQTDRVGRGE
jgi:hypothetical protein